MATNDCKERTVFIVYLYNLADVEQLNCDKTTSSKVINVHGHLFNPHVIRSNVHNGAVVNKYCNPGLHDTEFGCS